LIFLEAVKRSRIKQPTQHGFTKGGWLSEFTRLSDGSQRDKEIYEDGVWFYDKLAMIRRLLSEVDYNIEPTKLRHCLVAFVNRDYQVAIQAMRK
jgi:hypothetical protein